MALMSSIYVVITLGPCCIMMTFADDLYAEVTELHKQSKIKENGLVLTQKFGQFIKFHSAIKQLSCE